jgi:ribosome-associated translation inhibitor RaiA
VTVDRFPGDFRPYAVSWGQRYNETMRHRTELPTVIHVDVTTHGQLPGIDDYVQEKIGGLGRYAHQPLLHARVRLSRHADPAVSRPVIAQANLDVNGKLVRAQVDGNTAREAVDRLEARLRNRLERLAESREIKRDNASEADSHEWRHQSQPTHRLNSYPRPADQRRIIRRKSFTLGTHTVDEAAQEMELLDYDFHLFTEKGTKQASVLYRTEPAGYRLAQVKPMPDKLARHGLQLSVSPHPAPVITVQDAKQRLILLGLPFLFFIDADQGRADVLYHRYDGHYGLICPAG